MSYYCTTLGSALKSLCESVRTPTRPAASPPVCLSVCYQLVKMFITLEPHGIFSSHFAYICMSTFPNHCHTSPPVCDRYGIAVQLSSLLRSVSEIPHNKSKKEGKDKESIQSSTTTDPGYQWESDNFTIRHHKREPRGQPFPSR